MTADDEPTRARPKTPRGALHDEVADRLRAMIDEGELEPGARVPEQALCDLFGISRTPMREALKVLSSEGLVDLQPNKGATVASLTERDVDEMFEVMGALEALSGRLACARIAEAEIDEIRAMHYKMMAHYHRRERAEYFALNRRIHEAILKASGNSVLTSVYNGLSDRIRLARYQTTLSEPAWRQAVDEHEEILAGLTDRHGRRLSEVLQRHLRNKKAVVKSSYMGKGVQHGAAE